MKKNKIFDNALNVLCFTFLVRLLPTLQFSTYKNYMQYFQQPFWSIKKKQNILIFASQQFVYKYCKISHMFLEKLGKKMVNV